MRPILVAASMAVAIGAPSSLRADEPAWRDYPVALIDRPLTLPRLVFQPFIEGEVTNAHVVFAETPTSQPATGTGATISFGLDVGLTDRVQAGFILTLPVAPVADFGDLVFNLQYAVWKNRVSVRLDLGAQRQVLRYTFLGAPTADDFDGLVVGVGLPLRWKVHKWIAVTSGSTSARGFDAPPVVTAGGNTFFGTSLASQDLITLGFWPSVVGGVVHLPIGVLFQPHAVVSLGLRTGYRLAFSVVSSNGNATRSVVHLIPIALDLTFSVRRFLDLGVTASVAGTVAGDSKRGFLDVRQLALWATARF